MRHRPLRTLLVALAIALTALAHARFEWRDVVQDVTIYKDGSVTVIDERTLWTDEDFGEAFICIDHPAHVRVTLLDGSGAVSPGPPATAFQQACESGAAGTEVVIRQDQRVRERRIRFVYRFDGTLDVYRDVVQWYWNLIQLDHPPIVGYRLTITAPGPMAAPYDAFVHRYANPESPRVALSEDRQELTVTFDSIPRGDGVEIRYLMDPTLFTPSGTENALARLLADEARIASAATAPALARATTSLLVTMFANEFDAPSGPCPDADIAPPDDPISRSECYIAYVDIELHRTQLDTFIKSLSGFRWTNPWEDLAEGPVYARNLSYSPPGAPNIEVVVFLRAAGPFTVVYVAPLR